MEENKETERKGIWETNKQRNGRKFSIFYFNLHFILLNHKYVVQPKMEASGPNGPQPTFMPGL